MVGGIYARGEGCAGSVRHLHLQILELHRIGCAWVVDDGSSLGVVEAEAVVAAASALVAAAGVVEVVEVQIVAAGAAERMVVVGTLAVVAGEEDLVA